MVAAALSLTRSGLRDWIFQRISAVILGLYVLVLLGFFITHSPLTYDQWKAFFHTASMEIFSLMALLSLIVHSWIGVWTVITDYLKPLYLRASAQVLLIAGLALFFAWGLRIIL